MSESHKRRGLIGTLREKRLLRWTVIATLVPLAYVASFGPAIRGAYHGWLPQDLVREVYWPMKYIFDYSPSPISKGLNWYGDLWLGAPKPSPAPPVP